MMVPFSSDGTYKKVGKQKHILHFLSTSECKSEVSELETEIVKYHLKCLIIQVIA